MERDAFMGYTHTFYQVQPHTVHVICSQTRMQHLARELRRHVPSWSCAAAKDDRHWTELCKMVLGTQQENEEAEILAKDVRTLGGRQPWAGFEQSGHEGDGQ